MNVIIRVPYHNVKHKKQSFFKLINVKDYDNVSSKPIGKYWEDFKIMPISAYRNWQVSFLIKIAYFSIQIVFLHSTEGPLLSDRNQILEAYGLLYQEEKFLFLETEIVMVFPIGLMSRE